MCGCTPSCRRSSTTAPRPVEKPALFYRRLLPLLEFGREREGIDLSNVVLTHHTLKKKATSGMSLDTGDPTTPAPEAGSGNVQAREKARLAEIIAKVNDVFAGDLTEGDKLVFVRDVLHGKIVESKTLQQQALANTPAQFEGSPDLDHAITDAIIASHDAHATMSTQALNSPAIRAAIKDILIRYTGLYDALRQAGL
jgi:type I restriction enzyme R subunit